MGMYSRPKTIEDLDTEERTQETLDELYESPKWSFASSTAKMLAAFFVSFIIGAAMPFM
jgi:hypothetical protein